MNFTWNMIHVNQLCWTSSLFDKLCIEYLNGINLAYYFKLLMNAYFIHFRLVFHLQRKQSTNLKFSCINFMASYIKETLQTCYFENIFFNYEFKILNNTKQKLKLFLLIGVTHSRSWYWKSSKMLGLWKFFRLENTKMHLLQYHVLNYLRNLKYNFYKQLFTSVTHFIQLTSFY